MLLIPLFLFLGGTHVGMNMAGLMPQPTLEPMVSSQVSSEGNWQTNLSSEGHLANPNSADTMNNDSTAAIIIDSNASIISNQLLSLEGSLLIRSLERAAPFLLAIWIIGALLYLVTGKIAYLKFRRAILSRASSITHIHCKTIFFNRKLPVVVSKIASTPMLIGIITPIIVLPKMHLVDKEVDMILAHEVTHYKRQDLIVKLVMLLVNSVHWFNPFVYALNKQINIMCELSCDEKTVMKMDKFDRQFYGETILHVLKNGTLKRGLLYNTAFVTSLSDSQESIKGRLVNVITTKKMKKSTIILAVIIGVMIVGSSVIASNLLSRMIPVSAHEGYGTSLGEGVGETAESGPDETLGTILDEATEASLVGGAETPDETAEATPIETAQTFEPSTTQRPTGYGGDHASIEHWAQYTENNIIANGVGLPPMYNFFTLDGEGSPTHVPLFPVLAALGLSDISAGSQIAIQNQENEIIAQLRIVNYLAFGEGIIDMSGVGVNDVFMAQNFGIYAPLSFFREQGFSVYLSNGQLFIYQ